jgi:hypothetical protein
MLIQHLATTTHNVVKAERKPRRNIQYRDVAGAVGKTDNLEFLADVVPRTVGYGVWKKRKAAEAEREEEGRKKEKEGVETTRTTAGTSGENTTTNGATISESTLPPLPIDSAAAQSLLARAPPSSTLDAPRPGDQLDPLARKEVVPIPVSAPAAEAEKETEAMDVDVDDAAERVADSDGEEDPAAMQIEMEMRGPPRVGAEQGEGVEGRKQEAAPRISSGGFTAINGR